MAKAARPLKTGVLMILAVLAAARPSLAGEIVVRVQLRDCTGLQIDVIKRAENDVTAIYKRAGIDMVWVDLAEQNASLRGDGLITVNILTRALARQAHPVRDALGFTPVTQPAGHVTYVIGYRIDEMAQEFHQNKATVLGATIAHEIGHLLLPRVPHSIAGIMRASWGQPDLQLAAQGALGFLASQVQMLRATAEGRYSRRAD